jgi:hypothetical membrane protein
VADQRIRTTQGLAIAGLALILVYVFSEGIVPGQETRAFVFASSGLILSIAAFAIAVRKKSVLVSFLLVISGIILTIDGLIVTRNLTVVYFPGPAIDFIFALIVLSLGITKSAITAKSVGN